MKDLKGIAALREHLKVHPQDQILPIERDIAQLLVDAMDKGLEIAFTNYMQNMKYPAMSSISEAGRTYNRYNPDTQTMEPVVFRTVEEMAKDKEVTTEITTTPEQPK